MRKKAIMNVKIAKNSRQIVSLLLKYYCMQLCYERMSANEKGYIIINDYGFNVYCGFLIYRKH